MMVYNVSEVIKYYSITVKDKNDVRPYGNGHINDTYLVNADEGKYILQRINKSIFKNPSQLMDNVLLVTNYIDEAKKNLPNYNPKNSIHVIPTSEGKSYVFHGNQYFRMYNFVDAVSFDLSTNELVAKAGAAIGEFQNILDGFDASQLYETIPDFHNTVSRFADFERAIEEDRSHRKDKVKEDIELALSYKHITPILIDAIKDKSIPLRVTHNDTKMNNILFDKTTLEFACIVDLDTIMPGSLLYDFGDALRFCASSAAEDEKDLLRVYFELDKFESFTKGFLSQVYRKLTEREIELLPISALVLTYECAIRFLGDYLNGDVYFMVDYPEHNLIRARNQLKLVVDIDAKLGQMKKIVNKILNKLKEKNL